MAGLHVEGDRAPAVVGRGWRHQRRRERSRAAWAVHAAAPGCATAARQRILSPVHTGPLPRGVPRRGAPKNIADASLSRGAGLCRDSARVKITGKHTCAVPTGRFVRAAFTPFSVQSFTVLF